MKAPWWSYLWKHALVWLVVGWVLFPVIWIIAASLNPRGILVGSSLIPPNASLVHYVELFSNPTHPFGLWLWNSVFVSMTTAVLATLLCALAAYAFSRYRFRGRRAGLLALLVLQMFPQLLAVVAIYLLMQNISGIPYLGSLAGFNTHAGLIMVYLGGAIGFNTWLMKGFFDTLPRALEEAALIDGATRFQVFWRIVLPLTRPVLAVIFILVFILTYADFLLASVLLRDREMFTLSVGLQRFIANQYGTVRWGPFAAATVLGSVPIVIVFLIAQRWIISGLTRGSVKG